MENKISWIRFDENDKSTFPKNGTYLVAFDEEDTYEVAEFKNKKPSWSATHWFEQYCDEPLEDRVVVAYAILTPFE